MNLVCLRENKAKCVGVLERKNGVEEFFFLGVLDSWPYEIGELPSSFIVGE